MRVGLVDSSAGGIEISASAIQYINFIQNTDYKGRMIYVSDAFQKVCTRSRHSRNDIELSIPLIWHDNTGVKC